MIRKLKIGIWMLLWFGIIPTYGQDVQVKASLDSTRMLIGSQTKITLEVTQPDGIQTTFPVILDTVSRSVEVLEVSPIDSSRTTEGLLRLTSNLTVTSFDSGYHVLPPFRFISHQNGGSPDTFFTNSLALDIALVPVDTSLAIKPIKGLEQMPFTLREALPWILGGLLAIAIAIGLFYYFRNRKKAEEPTIRPKPKEPSHVIALRELDRLRSEKLWQSGQIKPYHSRLTDIIRDYIEHRFEIMAVEQTSDEILDSFKDKGLVEKVPFNNLEEMFHLADLVKFAKGKPKPDQNAQSLDSAYQFVEKTIKRELETENQSKNSD